MAKLDKHVLNEFAKTVTAEQQKDDGIIVYGIVISITDDGAIVRLDGKTDNILTPCATAVSVTEGDRVSVNVGRHQAIIIGNAETSPDPNGESKLVGGALAANKVITNYLNANYVKADVIAANYVATNYLESNYLKTGQLDAQYATIAELIADYIKTTELTAEVAKLGYLKADSATITNIQADTAKIHNLTADQLSAATGYVGTLVSDNITTNDIKAATGYVGTLEANHVTADNLIADTAKVHDLTADQLSAATGYIGTLTSNNITANDIVSGHATIGSLDSNYAHIDLANVNNAWIQNGVVKDAAISDAQIIGVSANKLTAGTIDASNIKVTNLNASNITTGTINGQRIGAGSLSLDKLAEDVYTEDEVDSMLSTMQAEIDGAIETFTGTVVPTLNNYPASSWTDADTKSKHVGDVYYVVNAGQQADGYCYRFAYDNTTGTYGWVLIKDSDVTAALQRLIDAEGDIDDLETFQSTTSSWITNTDEELTSLKSRTSSVETSLGNKVETSTFNELSQTVDANSSNITSLSSRVDSKADSSTVTTLSNTVNSVQQTANSNSSKISNLTTVLGTNADGTTSANDIVHKVSEIDQDLDGITTRVGKTETWQNNFQVGGRNLIKNTDSSTVIERAFPSSSSANYCEGYIATITRVDGISEYVASFDAKASVDNLEVTCYWYNPNTTTRGESSTGQTSSGTNGDTRVTLTTSWQRYWVKWKQSDTASTDKHLILCRQMTKPSSGTNTVYIRAPKMETGNKATDWTPAPEDIETRVSAAETSITQNADAIALRATKTDVTNAIDAIDIGGRNLCQKSDFGRYSGGNVYVADWRNTTVDGYTFNVTGNPGDLVGFRARNITGENITFSYETNLSTTTNYYAFKNDSLVTVQTQKNVTVTPVNGKVTYTLPVPNGATVLDIGFGLYPYSSAYYIKNPKIEKGNKVTDWTPAPEDLEAYADSAVSTAKAEIEVTTDGISQTVEKISSAKYVNSATPSWPLTNIKTYAAEGYSQNWNVTSTDNLREGDTVYVTGTDSTRNCKIYIKTTVTSVNSGTNFTGTSHGYEDVLPVETIKSTINQSADSVKIQANHVDIAGAAIFTDGRLSQTSLNNAYDAKGAASAVQTNLDNLSIGGRNLIKNTDSSTVIERAFPSSSSANYCEGYIATITRVDGISEYVASFDAKASVDNLEVTCYWYNPNTTTRGESSTGQTSSGTNGDTRVTLTTSWQRYWVKWKQSDTASTDKHLILCRQMTKPSSGTNTVYIRAPKMETGSKATDWSPAPEDALGKTQPIYYRSNSSALPAAPTAIVTRSDDINSTWTTRPVAAVDKNNTSYKYCYTCNQLISVGGYFLGTTPVVQDDGATVIDGSYIQTGKISADRIDVNTIKVSSLNNDSGFQTASQVQSAVNTVYDNFGYRYKYDIIVYGDSTSKYYPIYFHNATSQYIPHELMISRGYYEQAPSDWNSETFKGSLTLLVKWNYGGWGGATYNAEILAFSQSYSTMVGDVQAGVGSGMSSAIYLRGGGTTGALYHIYSEVPIVNTYNDCDFPYIGVTAGQVYMTRGTYTWTVASALATPNDTHLAEISSVTEEQYIYISKASGTSSVAATTTWVTNNADNQNTWSRKRPTYNSSYPVLFVAKQKKTITGLITCTTPVKDDTTTVIDGGHITTGTIDASKATITNINATNITAGTLKDSVDKNSWDLATGALTIKSGSINITTSSDSNDYIKLRNSSSDTYSSMSSNKFTHHTTSSTKLANKSFDRAETSIGSFIQRMGSDTYQEYGLTITGGAGNSSLYWGYPYIAMLSPQSISVNKSNSDGTQLHSAMNADTISTSGTVMAATYKDTSNNTITDYVIDKSVQSTYGYTKWASGKLECWRRETKTVNINTKWNYTYYNSTAISLSNYPVAFVGSLPMVIKTVETTDGSCWAMPLINGESLTNPGQITVLRDGSTMSDLSVTVMMYAVGKWK